MVKPGYKQTEIGVIPEDWEISKLGNIGQFKNGINKDKDKFGYGVPIIGLMDVFGMNHINSTSNSGLVDASPYEQEDYSLKEGDVLFVRSSVKPAGVGLTAVVEQTLQNAVFSGFLLRYRTEKLTVGFKRYAFYASYFRENLIAASTVSANTNINQDSLKQLVLAYPTNEAEQNKIAQTISSIDALLLSLEKQISKKTAIKQGAMQELLTGKKRLPGFSGRWYFETMSHYLEMQVGFPFSSQYFNNKGDGLRLIKNRDLKSDDQVYYTTEKCSAEYIVKNGDILIGMDGDFLPCRWNKGSSLLNQRVGRLIQKGPIYLQFAYYALEKPLLELQQGTGATTVKHLSHKDIANLSVWMPPSVDEQRAIAEILSGMDSEIEALEQKLTKYRQVKQGMMQQLLTGKIRLV